MNYRKSQINALYIVAVLFFFSCQKEIYSTLDSSKSSNNVSVFEKDTAFVNIIEPYKAKLDAQMNKVIGSSPIELLEGDYQSPLANLLNDMVLRKSIEYYGKPIDMALVTNGGLRTPIAKGDITVGSIFELMPFENELVVLTLKGRTVQKLMEYAAERGNAPMAGVKYEVLNGKPQNILIQRLPLDLEKNYTLSVSDYLANGGDGLGLLKEATNYFQLGKMYRTAILDGIEAITKSKMKVYGKLDDRVKILK